MQDQHAYNQELIEAFRANRGKTDGPFAAYIRSNLCENTLGRTWVDTRKTIQQAHRFIPIERWHLLKPSQMSLDSGVQHLLEQKSPRLEQMNLVLTYKKP